MSFHRIARKWYVRVYVVVSTPYIPNIPEANSTHHRSTFLLLYLFVHLTLACLHLAIKCPFKVKSRISYEIELHPLSLNDFFQSI